MVIESLVIAGAAYASVYALMAGAAASTFFWHHNYHFDPNILETNTRRIARGESPLPERYFFVDVTPDQLVCVMYGGNVSTYLMESSTRSCFEWQTKSEYVPNADHAKDWEVNRNEDQPQVQNIIWSKRGWLSPWYAARRIVRAVTGTHLVISPWWQVETREFRRIRYDIRDENGKSQEIYEPQKDFTGHLVHTQFQLHIISAGVPTEQGYNVKFHIVVTLRCSNPVLGFWEARGWEHQISVRVQNLVREFAQGASIEEVYAGKKLTETQKRALALFIREGLMGRDADPSASPPTTGRENFVKPLGFEVVKEIDIRDPDLDPDRAREIEGYLAAGYEGLQEGRRQKEILKGQARGRRKIIEEELAGAETHGLLAPEYLRTRAGVEAAKNAKHVDMLVGVGGQDAQTGMLAGIRNNTRPDEQPPREGTS